MNFFIHSFRFCCPKRREITPIHFKLGSEVKLYNNNDIIEEVFAEKSFNIKMIKSLTAFTVTKLPQ